MSQSQVYRQVTQGFPGDIVLSGPRKGTANRVVVPDYTQEKTIFTNTNTTNRFSRIFGYYYDYNAQGIGQSQTLVGYSAGVVVGGDRPVGLLAFTNRYVTYNLVPGLSSLDHYNLPHGEVGEFFTELAGVIIEIFNHTQSVRSIKHKDKLAYLLNTTAPEKNPLNLPYGSVIALAPDEAVPEGFALLPNSFVHSDPFDLSPSSADSLATGWVRCVINF